MSAFVASGTTETFQLTNDGWFPDLDAHVAREQLRIHGDVTDKRLEAALVNGMLTVNQLLRDFKALHVLLYPSLEDVPTTEINGQSRLQYLYQRAVICTAGAELVERYRDYSASAEGDKNAESSAPNIDDLRRDARWAISDLLGKRRTRVELI